MTPLDGGPSGWFFIVTEMMIVVAILIASYRVFRGPSLPDRVIALDMIGVLSVAMLAVFAVAIDYASLLSVAVVAALILFLGTAAFAIYIERRSPDQPEPATAGTQRSETATEIDRCPLSSTG
mgnify:CR=1 FL=1